MHVIKSRMGGLWSSPNNTRPTQHPQLPGLDVQWGSGTGYKMPYYDLRYSAATAERSAYTARQPWLRGVAWIRF